MTSRSRRAVRDHRHVVAEPDVDDLDEDLADEDARDSPPRRHLVAPAAAAVVFAVIGIACLAPPLLHPHHPGATVTTTAAAPQVAPSSPDPAPTTATTSSTQATSPPAPNPAPSVGTSATTPATDTAVAGQAQQEPEDLLAGPVGDEVLQKVLLESLPTQNTITDATLLDAADGRALLAAAWQGLQQDLQSGGWTQPREQAYAVMSRGRQRPSGQLPVVVDVVIMWAATTSSGDPTERELSQVQMNKGSGTWSVDGVTTASGDQPQGR